MEEENVLLSKPLTNIVKTETFMDRYTTKYITEDDIYYNLHTNNLVIIGLTKQFLIKHKRIKNINFRFKDKYDTLDFSNLVQGKKKSGGIPLSPIMKLCEIEFEDGLIFLLRSRIRGKIIEINEEILNQNFEIINKDPENDGYFFLVHLPSFEYDLLQAYPGFKKMN